MTATTNHARPVTVRRLHPADHADWARPWSGYLARYDEAMPDAQVPHAFDRLCAGEAISADRSIESTNHPSSKVRSCTAEYDHGGSPPVVE